MKQFRGEQCSPSLEGDQIREWELFLLHMVE